jgi:anti-anti-sigma regulatory factor
MSESNLSVWVNDKFACIRIVGRASFTSSVDFKTLVNSLWQQGRTRFVLDLTSCTLMDSTFLGILASLGLKFGQERNGDGSAIIQLLNPNQRICELLENLGVAQFFKVINGPAFSTDHLTPLDPAASHLDKKEVSRTCLEAHQFLMEINPANVPRFKDVARFLEEDLKRMETTAKPASTS